MAEIHFSYLILTRAPKSAETWAYRRRLIRTLGVHHIPRAFELRLTRLAANRVFSNYYATLHHVYVLPALDVDYIVLELIGNRKWLRTHNADSPDWTYHRGLLSAISAHGFNPDVDEMTWFMNMCRDYAAMYQSMAVRLGMGTVRKRSEIQ